MFYQENDGQTDSQKIGLLQEDNRRFIAKIGKLEKEIKELKDWIEVLAKKC